MVAASQASHAPPTSFASSDTSSGTSSTSFSSECGDSKEPCTKPESSCTALVIHAHFYQPPRENPWIGRVPREPSAHPYHDWNERIQHECYRPNARARILDHQGRIERVVDNYQLLSFNVGPTLMSWMETHDPQTYERIIRADKQSVQARCGHGNAIAQVYGHAILPLCNARDCLTQVRWGIADFVYRFERRPEAMWLPETACNDHTLGVLIDEGLKYVILSPYQALRVRALTNGDGQCQADVDLQSAAVQPNGRVVVGEQTWENAAESGENEHHEDLQPTQHAEQQLQGEGVVELDGAVTDGVASESFDGGHGWTDVSDGSIDPGVAYWYRHPDGSGRGIAVFFYDGPIARSIAFEGALMSSDGLVDHLSRGAAGPGRIVHVATDGESYGHHFAGGERCLAYALDVVAERRGFRVTNYGEYLQHHKPRFEVQIKPGPDGEGTAWSCAHGVGRWIRDCGCSAGARDGWNQRWRGPLREALDFLRDRAVEVFEKKGSGLLGDVWKARDAYINVLTGQQSREDFLYEHAGRHLRDSEQFEALALLEMQRNALLMYTSCGWFFADISGIETVQDLRYAARVMDWMQELEVVSPREAFLEILARAESNIPELGSGADVFRRFVEPTRVTTFGVASHLAIMGLAQKASQERGSFCGYDFVHKDCRVRVHGRLVAYTARLCLESQLVPHRVEFAALAMHFGGIDFYGALKVFPGLQRYKQSEERFWKAFSTESLTTILRVAHEEFGPDEFDLSSVLPEGREQVARLVFGNLIERFSEQYAHLYDDNARIIEKVQDVGFELPTELRVAAEFTLGRRFLQQITQNRSSHDVRDYATALTLAERAAERGYQLDRAVASKDFEQRINSAVNNAICEPTSNNASVAVALLELSSKLGLKPNLDLVQEAMLEAKQTAGSLNEVLEPLAERLGLSLSVG